MSRNSDIAVALGLAIEACGVVCMIGLFAFSLFLTIVVLVSRISIYISYTLEHEVEKVLVVTRAFGMTWKYSRISRVPEISPRFFSYVGVRARDAFELALERLSRMRRSPRPGGEVGKTSKRAIRGAKFTIGLYGFIVMALIRRGEFEEFSLTVEYGSGDAAATAIAVGGMHALLDSLVAHLSGLRQVVRGNVEIIPDFKRRRLFAHLSSRFTFSVMDVIWGIARYMAIQIEESFKQKNLWGKLARPVE